VGAGAAQKKPGGLILEADELWRFVGTRRCRWRAWVALDADPRPVVAMAAGGRDESTARCRWDALPDEYREGAVVCTDFRAAYRAVVPEDRHASAGKEAGLTCHVERFWCPLRQRSARFVRKTLSFSEKWENHIGALWYFIRLDNESRL